MYIANNGDNKLLAISEFHTSRARRKTCEDNMNGIEWTAFFSFNSCLA